VVKSGDKPPKVWITSGKSKIDMLAIAMFLLNHKEAVGIYLSAHLSIFLG